MKKYKSRSVQPYADGAAFFVTSNAIVRGEPMFKKMKTYTHLKPGQKGTLGLLVKYGDRLLCVRYRYDELRQVRLKTVEIIVDERPAKFSARFRDTDTVTVIVRYGDRELRSRLKQAGATWDPSEKVWRVLFGSIRGDVELVERIVVGK